MGPLEVLPYVTSFCASADKSIHWLHYGGRGTGVALEFDANMLATNLSHVAVMRRVIYEPKDQDAVINDILDSTLVAATDLARITRQSTRKQSFSTEA